MNKTETRISVVLYILTFAVNFVFATVDFEALLLPEYVNVYVTGGVTGHQNTVYKAYKKKSKYYFKRDNSLYELTRDEYRQCVDIRKSDLEDPEQYKNGSDAFEYTFEVKYPFSSAKTYDLGADGEKLASRFKEMYFIKTDAKDLRAHKITDAIWKIMDEYDVKGGYSLFHTDDFKDLIFRKTFCKLDYGKALNEDMSNDDRLRKIQDRVFTEIANVRTWDEGYTKIPYLGRNTYIMGKIIKHKTGKDVHDYLPYKHGFLNLDVVSIQNVKMFGYIALDKPHVYVNSPGYLRFRYFEHGLKDGKVVYFKTETCKDLTIMTYKTSDTNDEGIIVFETDDFLTRSSMIFDMKIAILTDGRYSSIPGTHAFIHFMFIYFVETALFGAVMFLFSRKRSNV